MALRRSFQPAASGLAVVVLLSCARPSETVRTHDLLRLLPAVPHGPVKTALDIGTADAEAYSSGLSWNESTEDGTTFSWSDGPSTTFDFFVAESRPGRLALRGLPWPGAASEPGGQRVAVTLNGAAIDSLIMDGSVQELSVALRAVAPGRNRVELTYSTTNQPAPEDQEQRALGVAWDWARLELEPPATGEGGPVGDLLRDRLLLPPGSWVEYALEIEPASELVIDRVSGSSTLLVSRSDESSGPATEVVRLSAGRNLRQAIATDEARTVWLTLSNPGSRPLRLRSPRLEARRAP